MMMRKKQSNVAKIAGRIAGGIAIGGLATLVAVTIIANGVVKDDERDERKKEEADAKQWIYKKLFP